MEYQIKFERKPAYLHAAVTGQNSRENVTRYLEEILGECVTRGCQQVLIEECLEGPRLGTADVYRIVTEGSDKARGVLRLIAFVDVNSEGNNMRFAEDVAVNRSLTVSVFKTVAEAEKWLEQSAG